MLGISPRSLAGSSEALEHYSDSLEAAELRGNDAQVLFDLLGVANVLGVLGADQDAIEVAGMAEKLIAELGGPEVSATHLVGQEAVLAGPRAPWSARDGEFHLARSFRPACSARRADVRARTRLGPRWLTRRTMSTPASARHPSLRTDGERPGNSQVRRLG